ncbi:MAG: hypothetical protein EBW68_06470 [Actinobacteria bacterium]|nr:hypothetical protein [Actinomycetota bacterium]
MTTIRLVPSQLDLEVRIDPTSVAGLFDESLEIMVTRRVDENMIGLQDTVIDNTCDNVMENRDFLRRIRDWAIESIDFGDIAMRSAEYIDAEMLENALCTDRFVRTLTDTTRFRNVVRGAMDTYMSNINITTMVQEAVNTAMLNVVNDAAERAVTLIQNRLNARSDV